MPSPGTAHCSAGYASRDGHRARIGSNRSDVPIEIAKCITSFLCYSEQTMDCPASKGYFTSNPSPKYGTEAMLVLTPPIRTGIPSNCYILHSVRWRVDDVGDGTVIFIGIQAMDPQNVEPPGNGEVVYAQKVNSFLLWMTSSLPRTCCP